MRGIVSAKRFMWIFALVGAVLAQARPANGQDSGQPENQKMDIDKIGVLLQQLQSQIKDLHAEVHALKAQQQSAKADSDELRKRLDEANARNPSEPADANSGCF